MQALLILSAPILLFIVILVAAVLFSLTIWFPFYVARHKDKLPSFFFRYSVLISVVLILFVLPGFSLSQIFIPFDFLFSKPGPVALIRSKPISIWRLEILEQQAAESFAKLTQEKFEEIKKEELKRRKENPYFMPSRAETDPVRYCVGHIEYVSSAYSINQTKSVFGILRPFTGKMLFKQEYLSKCADSLETLEKLNWKRESIIPRIRKYVYQSDQWIFKERDIS